MDKPLDLSIIMVNWNSAKFVQECIRSIHRFTAGLTYEIIVIDNASYDGYERVLEEFPEVICIQSNENLGFAKANNRAYEVSRGKSLLFLNPDTEIVGQAIVRLHTVLKSLPEAGAVGARLLNRDGTLQTSCIQAFPTLWNQVLASDVLQTIFPTSRLWGMVPLYRQTVKVDEVECISGACLMMRREVFEQIGRFSEDYFMYTEDLDLCYKARRAGWKNYYVPDATVVHFGGSSSKQAASNFSNVMMKESVGHFLRKTHGFVYWLVYRVAMFLCAICRLGIIVALFPIQYMRGKQQCWMASCRKWWAILQWSLRGVQFLRVG